MLRIRLLVGVSGGVCVAYALCRIAAMAMRRMRSRMRASALAGHEHIGVARARIER